MRWKTDENVHPDVAAHLRECGHDAVTVWDEHMRGAVDDDILGVCREENRVLLTLDLDFSDIRAYPPERHAGIVVLRLGSQHRSHVLRVVADALPRLTAEAIAGRLWIVDERSIRVRGGDDT